jgi:hypothetical protein
MTARTRVLEWFVAPAVEPGAVEPAPETEWLAPSAASLLNDPLESGAALSAQSARVRAPLPGWSSESAATRSAQVASLPGGSPESAATRSAQPARVQAPLPGGSPEAAVTHALTSAAVLGRPGEAEPVAAALALVLRRLARARAATVCVLGPVAGPRQTEGAGAARRLAARLEAHGLEAGAKGRLAWVQLPAAETAALAAARRAVIVGPPAVLALTSPRSPAVDELLAEQDLVVVVTGDPDGPLARLAIAAAHGPLFTIAPLPRGIARALARAGVRPARALTELVATAAALDLEEVIQ